MEGGGIDASTANQQLDLEYGQPSILHLAHLIRALRDSLFILFTGSSGGTNRPSMNVASPCFSSRHRQHSHDTAPSLQPANIITNQSLLFHSRFDDCILYFSIASHDYSDTVLWAQYW